VDGHNGTRVTVFVETVMSYHPEVVGSTARRRRPQERRPFGWYPGGQRNPTADSAILHGVVAHDLVAAVDDARFPADEDAAVWLQQDGYVARTCQSSGCSVCYTM